MQTAREKETEKKPGGRKGELYLEMKKTTRIKDEFVLNVVNLTIKAELTDPVLSFSLSVCFDEWQHAGR